MAAPLKRQLDAVQHYKIVLTSRIRRTDRVAVILNAEIEHVLHEAVQVPVRAEQIAGGPVRFRCLVIDVEERIAEFQLPSAQSIAFCGEETVLGHDRSNVSLL